MTEKLLRELRLEIALLEESCAHLRAKIAEEEYPRVEKARATADCYLTVFSSGRKYKPISYWTEAFDVNSPGGTILRHNSIESPMPLQRVAWPLLMQGRNTLLLGPKGVGKFFSVIPIVASRSERCRVIIASTRERSHEYYEAFVSTTGQTPLITETPVSRRVEVNIICCTFAALPKIARNERSFLCVIDGFDKLAEQGAGTHMGDILRILSRRSTGVIASARRFTEATADLARRIDFPIIVAMRNRCKDPAIKRCLLHIEISYPTERFDILKRYLRKRNHSEDVVLLLVESKAAANLLESDLSDVDIYAQSLQADEETEGELARSSLRTGQPGIFIGIPRDFSWLQEVGQVDVLIDLQSIQSPSAFSMRESRVKASGHYVAFIEPTDLQASLWLLTLLKKRRREYPPELEMMYSAYLELTRNLIS